MGKRHIQLQVITGNSKAVSFRVWKCSHTGKEFTDKGCVFNASNGVDLVYRDSEFVWHEFSNSLYLSEDCKGSCGYVRRNEPVSVSPGDFAKICEAVEEYNNTEWSDEKGRSFWHFDSFFNLSYAENVTPESYEIFRKTGNCFHTRAEAEAVIERMRDQLCKMDEERNGE